MRDAHSAEDGSRPGAGAAEWPLPGYIATGYDHLMKVRFWHFDAALSTLFAMAGVWMFFSARAAAADAVRRYGYNADSGAIEGAVVVVFLLPVALLFGVAAVAGARGWRPGRYLHWLAVAAAVAPVAYEAAGSAFR